MGHLKCNTDGTSRENPGLSSYGFCIRDHKRDLCYAKARAIRQMTNIQAEARAILEAVRYCAIEEHSTKILEIDSLVILNIIKKVWKIPWELAEMGEEIHEQIHK